MIEASPDRALFRLYAVTWLVGLSMAAVVAYELAGPPRPTVVVYLATGAGLWLLDLAFVATRRRATAGPQGDNHAVAHAVLTAALALVWPLVLAGILTFVIAALVHGLCRDRQAA